MMKNHEASKISQKLGVSYRCPILKGTISIQFWSACERMETHATTAGENSVGCPSALR